MQKEIWYYEKWVGRHASFPPRRSVKEFLSGFPTEKADGFAYCVSNFTLLFHLGT
jgi:hypothetical protein